MEALQNYKSHPETQSCYLDGRYFNLVLGDIYPGTVTNPIHVHMTEDEKGELMGVFASMPTTVIDSSSPAVIRVIINRTNKMRHSALVIVDFEKKTLYYWNPKTHHDPMDNRVASIISDTLTMGRGSDTYKIEVDHSSVPEASSPSQCAISGYCNGFIIKRIYDQVMQQPFDPSHIRRFCHAIEDSYSQRLVGEPDIEFDTNIAPAAAGLAVLGGVALGGLLANTYDNDDDYYRRGYGYGYPLVYPYPLFIPYGGYGGGYGHGGYGGGYGHGGYGGGYGHGGYGGGHPGGGGDGGGGGHPGGGGGHR
jgi:hypothetical protein